MLEYPMTFKELMIERVKTLCANYGVDTVAEQAEISVDNLKQIVAGTKLPSGAPRGVGPKLQRALDRAYPGWSGELSAADDRIAQIMSRVGPPPKERDVPWPTSQDLRARIALLDDARLWALESVVRAHLGIEQAPMSVAHASIQALSNYLMSFPEGPEKNFRVAEARSAAYQEYPPKDDLSGSEEFPARQKAKSKAKPSGRPAQ